MDGIKNSNGITLKQLRDFCEASLETYPIDTPVLILQVYSDEATESETKVKEVLVDKDSMVLYDYI